MQTASGSYEPLSAMHLLPLEAERRSIDAKSCRETGMPQPVTRMGITMRDPQAHKISVPQVRSSHAHLYQSAPAASDHSSSDI